MHITFDEDFATATIDGETFGIDWFGADDLGFVDLVWLKDGRCFIRNDADDDDAWEPATPMLHDTETGAAIRPATSREHQECARHGAILLDNGPRAYVEC